MRSHLSFRVATILFLLLAVSGLAHAQSAGPTCTSSTGTPPVLRKSGHAELTGDFLVTCTGGFPTPSGQSIPQTGFSLILNTRVTSRLLSASTGASEVLMLIDEPGSSSNPNQLACRTIAGCPVIGTGGAAEPFDGTAGRPNIFQGVVSGNVVTFSGVPFDPPGSTGARIFRFVNVRADATGFGSEVPITQINESISIGGGTIPVTNPTQTTGVIALGYFFDVRDANNTGTLDGVPATFANCASTAPTRVATLRFAEGFQTALKRRSTAAFVDANTSPAPANQNVPGAVYNTETGFFNSGLQSDESAPTVNTAGRADSGTRLKAVFSNIPPGVSLYVDPVNIGATSAKTARLISTESGAFAPLGTIGTPVLLTPVGGSATAVWEILAADPAVIENIDIGVYASSTGGAPPDVVVTTGGTLAPTVFTAPAASDTAPLPRFNDTTSLINLLSFTSCPIFTITSVNGVTPSGALVGAADVGLPSFTMIITGTNFAAGSVVQWVGLGGTTTLTPTSITPGQINVVIPGAGTTNNLLRFPDSPIIRVVDPSARVATAPNRFQVNPALVISDSIPTAVVGTFFNANLVSGGTPPVSVTRTSGALPAGLTLSASGVLSGTPQSATASPFTLHAADPWTALDRLVNVPIELPPPPPLEITTASPLSPATQGVPYGAGFAASGGKPPYSFSLSGGSLPPGLSFSGGRISGTPTTPGTFRFTVQVTDSDQRTATKDFSLQVKAPPLVITTSSPLDNGFVGVALSQKFAATGGVLPFVWGALGAIPPGTTFSSAGVLSGTPTSVGTFEFTVQVTDAEKNTANKGFSITITARPVTITTDSPLSSGTVGVGYSNSLSAAGGTPPYSFAPTSVAPGIQLAASGSISGTPTDAGNFSFTATVTDSRGANATKDFAITINPAPLIITTGELPSGTVGVEYGQSISASGGRQPYRFDVSGGALPDGLSLGSGGAISGRPTTRGTFQFTARVTDATGQTATKDFSITVVAPPLVITTSSPLGPATFGVTFSTTLAATGGVPPLGNWSVDGLPSGLSLDAASGTISGTPTAVGDFNFSASVVDQLGTRASKSFSLRVNLPSLSAANFTGLPDVVTPAGQPDFQVRTGATLPLDVTIEVTLTFRPDSGRDDQAVQFASGGRTATATVAAGSDLASFRVQTGTTAGVITLTARFRAGATDLTPTPAPTRTIRVDRLAPVISSVRITRTASGISVEITGFDTTRGTTEAVFRLTAAPGANLQTTEIRIPVQGMFSAFFGGSDLGGLFTYVQPFTLQGDSNAVGSITVILNNPVGSSAPVTVNVPAG